MTRTGTARHSGERQQGSRACIAPRAPETPGRVTAGEHQELDIDRAAGVESPVMVSVSTLAVT